MCICAKFAEWGVQLKSVAEAFFQCAFALIKEVMFAFMDVEYLNVFKSIMANIFNFIVHSRSFFDSLDKWLRQQNWSCEIYFVAGVVCLMLLSRGYLMGRRVLTKIAILGFLLLILLVVFALIPVWMLARFIIAGILLWGLGYVVFLQRGITYNRPEYEDENLGRRLFYKRNVRLIRRMLLRNLGKSGLTVAVYGAWGSGKSHFLRYIERNLCVTEEQSDVINSNGYTGKCVIAKVDLWQTHTMDEAWEQIAVALSASLTGWRSYISHTRVVNSFMKAVTAINEKKLSPFVYVVKDFLYGGDDYSDGVNEINKMLKDKEGAAVLFLDNVERCDIEIVMKLLPLLERLKKIHNLVVIAAIAREELEARFVANGYTEEQLQGALNKLFDNVMRLPECSENSYTSMFYEMVKHSYYNCPTLRHYVQRRRTFIFGSPREVERIVDHLAAVDERYLARYSNKLNDGKWISCYECVFKMEIVRLLYPKIYSFLLRKNDVLNFLKKVPRELLSRYLQRQKENMPVVNNFTDSNEQWIKKNLDFMELLKEESNAIDYFDFFSQQNSDDFEYALKMKYVLLEDLSDIEYEEIIDLSLNGSKPRTNAVQHAIEKLYGDCREPEKNQIVARSVIHAVSKLRDRKALKYALLVLSTCFERVREMDYVVFCSSLFRNIAIDASWKHIEKLIVSKLNFKQIDGVLEDAFIAIIRENQSKEMTIYAEVIKGNPSLLEKTCMRYIREYLKIALREETVIQRSRYAFDMDITGLCMPYYEQGVNDNITKIAENLNKCDVFRRIMNSMCYLRKNHFDEKNNVELLLSETFFNIIVHVIKMARLQYNDIRDDINLVTDVKAKLEEQLIYINKYIEKKGGESRKNILEASFERGAHLAKSYVLSYLDEIRRGEEAAKFAEEEEKES